MTALHDTLEPQEVLSFKFTKAFVCQDLPRSPPRMVLSQAGSCQVESFRCSQEAQATFLALTDCGYAAGTLRPVVSRSRIWSRILTLSRKEPRQPHTSGSHARGHFMTGGGRMSGIR